MIEVRISLVILNSSKLTVGEKKQSCYQLLEIVVNEKVENKFAFTPLDKYNRLNEINPNLELLKKTFDLDI